MADALDSKSSMGNHVRVQVPPPVLLCGKDLRRRGVSPFLFFDPAQGGAGGAP